MSTFLNLPSEAFSWVLQTSWQAAVLACLIFVVQAVFRKQISPAWKYGLWSLLFVRLLMPFHPQSALSIFRLARLETPRPVSLVSPGSTPVSPNFVAIQALPPTDLPASATRAESETSIPPVAGVMQDKQPVKSTGSVSNLNWFQLAAAVWFLGGACWSALLIWTNLRFLSRLKCGMPVSDPAILRDFADCLTAFRIKQPVALIETTAVDGPAVYGVWHKRLLLPQGILTRFSSRELHYVFLHELAHIKRRDLELNWLVVILQILHWFNPVLWFAFSKMRADRELATDALALTRAGSNENTHYGETIIKLAEWFAGPKSAPALVGIAEDKTQIKRRIIMIANARPKKTWPLVSVTMFAVVAVLALTDSPDSTSQPRATLPGDALAEAGVSANAAKLIAALKQKSRWTFGAQAVLFGDEDGEVSGGLVRSVQLRSYAMSPVELESLGGPSADGLPLATTGPESIQWNFQNDLKSTDSRVTLVPRAVIPAAAPDFSFIEAQVSGGNATVMRFSAGTCFEVANPFKDPVGNASLLDYTVIMDVMFPDMTSRWAALWQTDPKNKSDAEWLISTDKGIGITDTYGGRIQSGEWHRVALVLRSSEATFLSYIDGKEVQRKYLDVKDEFFNRRLDEDVMAWTDTLSKLRNLEDPAAATAVAKFNIRLENSLRRSRENRSTTSVMPDLSKDTVAQVAAARIWASLQPTMDLARTLEGRSRWTLGPRVLLFADENGENAGGLVNAVQLRNYAMADDEVAALSGPEVELTRPASDASAQIAQWDFRGDLESSTGGAGLIPRTCPPATQAGFSFEPLDKGSTKPEVARFTRGTCFELATGFSNPDGSPWCLNYSVVMDVKFEDRPVGWVSLWQNDFGNRTDADWFINKKKELGIRDLYGGSVDNGDWNRLALVVDGKSGTISHFVNGKKVRTKLMILEDDFGRRGGAEFNLNSIVGLLAELRLRNDPQASSLVQSFARRMHNRPDPDSASRAVPFDVHLTEEATGKPISSATISYQMGESSEDFFPEAMKTDSSGHAQMLISIPVANRVHLSARAPGYAASSITVSGADILSGAVKSVQLKLSRSMKIGGVVIGENNNPRPNVQVRIRVDVPAASVVNVQAWDELVQTRQDGSWSADFIPATAEKLTIIFYAQPGAPEAVAVSRDDPAFEELKKLTSTVQLQPVTN